MTNIVGRFTIPVDDRPHEFKLLGEPMGVVAVTTQTVEFWAVTNEADDLPTRKFIIVGTGHALLPGWRHVGTAPRTAGLVWHLIEVPA
jgi:hypothetical protein